MKLKNTQGGFTLIELLVVVAIIAMLATMTFNIGPKILMDAKSKSQLGNAHQIHQLLIAYANNNSQVLPNETADKGEIQNSNQAYRQLFVKGLVDDEKMFYIEGCPWHGKTKPDGNIGAPEDNYSQALSAGENHWGYVSNLAMDDSVPTNVPVIMDGGTDGSPGKWSREPKEKGGLWKGRYAIVVRLSGEAKVTPLDSRTLTVMDKKNGQDVDIFSSQYGSDPQNAKNPLGN
jgi:prepilin-type N-terminal cleavage/methylation domain-containing protein